MINNTPKNILNDISQVFREHILILTGENFVDSCVMIPLPNDEKKDIISISL